MLRGDRRALARLLSLLDLNTQTMASISKAVLPHLGNSYCVGITGPPGAGKSTIVDCLIKLIRKDGLKIGVLAIDPTSPFTGGAILGDRIRMRNHYLDQNIFIRSLGTRGVHGGLSRIIGTAINLMSSFGFEIIIVETVGVGQTELDIINVADTSVIVLVPESGDSIQTMKSGVIEIADIFVVNKSDRDEATRLVNSLETTLNLIETKTSRIPEVLMTQAHRDKGIISLYSAILEHRKFMESDCNLEEHRHLRRKNEFSRILKEFLGNEIDQIIYKNENLKNVVKKVERNELDPYTAAIHIINNQISLEISGSL